MSFFWVNTRQTEVYNQNILNFLIKNVASIEHIMSAFILELAATPSSLLNSFATPEVQLQSSSPSQHGVTEQVNC